MTVDMDDEEIDKESLHEELGQIKQAVGLQDEHPYWWRWWLVEGVGVGILLPLIEWGMRDGFSIPLIGGLIAVFVTHQLALYHIQSEYERPTTGIPSWEMWHLVVFAALGAVMVGMNPLFDAIDSNDLFVLWLVIAGGLLGLGYLSLGQLLAAHNIRKADRYAFHGAGLWILGLVAVVPYLPQVYDWVFTIFGVSYACYCIAAYGILSRV